MKHIQFIKTVHPSTHRSVYLWVIGSCLLLVVSISAMAYISIGQWRLMRSFSEEKNRLMHHESEHAAIVTKKTGMLEEKQSVKKKLPLSITICLVLKSIYLLCKKLLIC